MFRILLLLFSIALHAAQTNAPDQWLQGEMMFPRSVSKGMTSEFSSLHAEAVSGDLQIVWVPPVTMSNEEVRLKFSADAPGHWPTRDWRSLPMQVFGEKRKVTVPLDSVLIPVAYFVETRNGKTINSSAMRVVFPRELGIEEPQKYFWPFLDGFEQGMESWRSLNIGAAMSISAEAKSGKAALSVRIPASGNFVAVGTTRLRGWFAQEHQARGFGFWARATQRAGEVRCSLIANAFTANQVLVTQERATKLDLSWKRVDVPFADFPRFPIADLDLISFEFIGSDEGEFLMDDLFLLGRWRFE
jgi:hypothetical protein